MRRRRYVKPYDITQLLHEGGIPRQFEDAPAMRCKTVGRPDSLYRHDTKPYSSGHRSRGPVRRLMRWRFLRQAHQLGHLIRRDRGLARRSRFVRQEALNTCLGEACLPAPDAGLDLPVVAIIPCVPLPSAVKRTIRARQTCFWGVFRPEMIASSRLRSAVETMKDIPVRMPQTRMLNI